MTLVPKCQGGSAVPGAGPGTDPGIMSMNFRGRPVTTEPNDSGTGPAHGSDGPRQAQSHLIDWRATRRADRACCCPARPVVIAVIPPSPNRAFPTDLLLCGHHYRACRRSLSAAGAAIVDMNGFPLSDSSPSAELIRV
jgi:hypothetical protein